MRAVLLTESGMVFDRVPDPTPGVGEVLVRVEAAGLCHSDVTLAGRDPARHPFDLPLVLGHELAGTVVDVGLGVTRDWVGAAVVGYGPRGCGRCRQCAAGADNHCAAPSGAPLGLGSPGALAEYVAIPVSQVLGAEGVSAMDAAVLSDAGLTVRHALGRSVRPGDTVLIVGLGGLGHLAPGLARHLGAARVFGADRNPDKIRQGGADGDLDEAWLSDEDLVERVRAATGGRGVDVLLDLVGVESTLALAPLVLAPGGVLSLVGVSTARIGVGAHALPLGCRVDVPFWGTRGELHELLSLARAGRVRPRAESILLDDVLAGYERLRRGEVEARLVARPQGLEEAR